jgi:hypothetical protein
MRRRHRVILWSLLGSPLFIGGLLIAAFIWRKPLTESIIAAYLQRNYGIATELAIGEIGASEIRVDHVKLGNQAPLEARNVRIAYDLSGHISAVEAAEISAHGKIEGGTVTLGDLEPLIAGGSDSTGGEAKLPEQISIERLNFQLGTPLGDLTIGGKALLGKGALALDLTATDSGGHTKGAAKVDISDAMAQPTMSGEIRLTLEPGSALWGFAPEIAPQAGTVEASVILDHVTPMDGAAAGGKPVLVALKLNELQNPQLAAPLSGQLRAEVSDVQLPLQANKVAFDLTGGWSKATHASGDGTGALALVDGKLALELSLKIAASDDKVEIAGWRINQPTLDAPLRLAYTRGELVIAPTDTATVTHKGIADLAKVNAIAAGKIALKPDGSGFHLTTSDGHWRATATTAALDFNVKSTGETVKIQAPAVSVSAENNAAGIVWTLNTAKVAFQNQARGMSGKNAVIKLSGQQDNIAGEVRISTFTAGAGLPTLTLNGDGQLKGSKLTAQLNAITGAGGGVNLGKVKVSGNLANRSYQADLDLGPIAFVVGGLQPAHLFPAAKAYIEDFSGTVRLEGPITWAKAKAKSNLKLGLEKLSGTAGPVQFVNMNGVIIVDEPWPVSTAPGQEIAIEQILAGLPMSNALLRFELDAPVMRIAEGRLDMAGGRASIAPTDINMTAAGQRMTLKIDQLSVSELFKVAGVAGLSGEGTISGQAPITLFPNGIIIDKASFAAEAPGVLRYDAAQAPGALSSAGDSVGLALQALSDFQYKELVVTLDRRLTGDTDLGLHISGSNPSFYNGYPVEFNLNLSGKLDEVLRKGLAGYRLPSTIQERLNDLQ